MHVCVCVCTRECIVRTYVLYKNVCLYCCVMCDAIYYWLLLYLSPPGISRTRSDSMVGTGIALCQMLHGICACVDVLANCSRCMYVCVRMYVLEAVYKCMCMYVRMCACVVYISELGHTYCTFTYVCASFYAWWVHVLFIVCCSVVCADRIRESLNEIYLMTNVWVSHLHFTCSSPYIVCLKFLFCTTCFILHACITPPPLAHTLAWHSCSSTPLLHPTPHPHTSVSLLSCWMRYERWLVASTSSPSVWLFWICSCPLHTSALFLPTTVRHTHTSSCSKQKEQTHMSRCSQQKGHTHVKV